MALIHFLSPLRRRLPATRECEDRGLVPAVCIVAGVMLVAAALVGLGFRPQDGDHHVQLAADFAKTVAGHGSQATALSFWPWPNQLADLALGIMTMAVGPDAAEVVLLIFLPGGLCAALGYFWTRHKWSPATATAIAAPFAIGATYGLGFYNFQLSLVLAFAVAAAATDTRGTAKTGNTAIIWVGLAATWLAHIVGFGMLIGYLLLVDGVTVGALRNRLRQFWPALLPVVWWFLAAPKDTVEGGDYDVIVRILSIGSWDAFLTIYNSAERLAVVILAAVVYLIVGRLVLATPDLKSRMMEPTSAGLAVITVGALAFAVGSPPSVFNGSYIWHRVGMIATIFAIAWVGRTLVKPTRRAETAISVVSLAVFFALAGARLSTIRTVADQRDQVLALASSVYPDDVVAAVSGSSDTYTRAFPLDHVAGRVAVEADATFLSNIVSSTGQALMYYPDDSNFIWGGVPRTPFDDEPLVPTVFVAVGDLDAATVAKLRSEGYAIVETSPTGLASLWRR